MGQAKRMMEEIEDRGWSGCDRHVCPDCVLDAALKQVMREEATSATCDYCGHSTPGTELAAPVDVLLDAVVQGLRSEYEDPVQGVAWDSREGGWQGAKVHDTDALLLDLEITEDGDLLADLSSAIQVEQWCQRDPYAAAPHEALIWGWQGFREHVTHRVRFMFLDEVDSEAPLGGGEIAARDMPAAVRTAIAHGQCAMLLAAGTTFWRARPFEVDDVPRTAKQMGSPPDHLAKVNRMTPAGISAFYGASSRDGALAEVRAYAGNVELAVAQFVTAHELLVIDLRSAPAVPSLFDADRRRLRAAHRFLREFAADVALPARPDDGQHLDYVPTQVVAEYLRYRFRHEHAPVRGVLWRSSLDPSVDDCVLFVDNDGCAEATRSWTDGHHLGLVPGTLEIVPPTP